MTDSVRAGPVRRTVIGLVVLVARTALEDRMLRVGLDGCAAYAAVTRNPLLPGIW